MEDTQSAEALLGPFRILDLTDEKGMLCGKILGDLGADVVKIEKPGGDPARNIGPFYHDDPHPEKSLYWLAFNTSKRSITLNLETAGGQALFKRLVKTAHFVIESYPPGYLAERGLDYPALSEINKSIIMTSITPFGQTGPYKDYRGSDIVCMATGGYMYLCGHSDRPPVRFSFPQSFLVASMDAAAGTMVAHYYRQLTGEGQHVDVSIQETVSMCLSEAAEYWDLNKLNVRREGIGRRRPTTGVLIPESYTCSDGYVAYIMSGGLVGKRTNEGLSEWMGDDFLKSVDWANLDYGSLTQEEHDRLARPIAEFFKQHTKAEIYDEAVKRRLMIFPSSTMEDIAGNAQLAARDYWAEIEQPGLGVLRYPGAFAKLSKTPCRIGRRPPLIGEHNAEIYEKDLGLPREEIMMLKQGNVI